MRGKNSDFIVQRALILSLDQVLWAERGGMQLLLITPHYSGHLLAERVLSLQFLVLVVHTCTSQSSKASTETQPQQPVLLRPAFVPPLSERTNRVEGHDGEPLVLSPRNGFKLTKGKAEGSRLFKIGFSIGLVTPYGSIHGSLRYCTVVSEGKVL